MKTTFMVAVVWFGMALTAVAQVPPVVHNSWSSGAAVPTPVWAPGGTAVLKGEIYVIGGWIGVSETTTIADTQIYNPATNSWTTGVPLPNPIADGAAAVVKNVLYLIGGTPDGSTESNAVWAFNPKTKTWSSKAAMPTARASMSAVIEKNKIYVVGGYANGLRLNTVESYNPATNSWTEEAPLLVGKSDLSAGLIGTTIVAAGGFSSGYTGDNEGYSASANSWKSLTPDPTARAGACTGSIGPQLYLAGGQNNPSSAFSVTESFKVSNNKWTTLASIPQATAFPGSAVYKFKVNGVTDSVLYCIGGTASQFGGPILDYVQIYQP